MKSMLRCGLLILALLFSWDLSAQVPPIDELRQKLESEMVFIAEIEHRMYDPFSNTNSDFSGQIIIGLNAYKVISDQRSYLVFNGESKVYEPEEARLLVSDYDPEEDDNAPSRFLYEVDDVYTVDYKSHDKGSTVRLTSDDPFELYYEVIIEFDNQGMPLSIKAVDQANTELLTRFKNGRFSASADSFWSLEIPQGVEVIDLRDQ